MTLPAGSQGRGRGTMRGTGELHWSLERNRLLRSSAELNVDVDVEVTAQGQTVRVRVTIKGTDRDEALPAESLSLPAIPADRLIVPGKGIGDVTFDIPVQDLGWRFGQPDSRAPDLGFTSGSVQWPNGLVGFVDKENQDRLVGLEIGDRRFRTDKRIGFGSSQGAVLIAYGMAPTTVTMSIPRLGGVRLLISNDQGIAFAITSDKEHSGRGPSHAPIGAVDWIAVFPPGGASKIFPMP